MNNMDTFVTEFQLYLSKYIDSPLSQNQIEKSFAEYIRTYREMNGFESISQLAQKTQITEAELHALERGMIPAEDIRVETLYALSSALKIDIDMFALILKRDISLQPTQKSEILPSSEGSATSLSINLASASRLAMLRLETTTHHRFLIKRIKDAQTSHLRHAMQAPPSNNPSFIGREEHISMLAHICVSQDSLWTVALCGEGGIGKTTLAKTLAEWLLNTHQFDKVVWITGQSATFNQGRNINNLLRPQLTITSLVNQLYSQVVDNSIDVIQPSWHEQLNRLTQQLNTFSYFIVIDNVEDVENINELLPVLREWTNPTRILITCRRPLTNEPDIYHFSIPELDEKSALSLVRATAYHSAFDIFDTKNKDERTTFYRVIGGNPLAIRLAIGQLHFDSLGTLLTDLQHSQGKGTVAIIHYLYRRAWHTLNRSEQQFLLAMAFTDEQGATQDEISAICNLSTNVLQAALQRLLILNLVDMHNRDNQRRYTIHTLTRDFLRDLLSEVRNVTTAETTYRLFDVPKTSKAPDYITLFQRYFYQAIKRLIKTVDNSAGTLPDELCRQALYLLRFNTTLPEAHELILKLASRTEYSQYGTEFLDLWEKNITTRQSWGAWFNISSKQQNVFSVASSAPTTYPRWINGDDAISHLIDICFRRDSSSMLAILGNPGVGKTTMAITLAQRLQAANLCDKVIWVTTQQFFVGQQPVSEKRECSSLVAEFFVKALCTQLANEFDDSFTTSMSTCLNKLTQQLETSRYLIVVDNLETDVDVEVLLPTLRSLSGSARFILTSQEVPKNTSDIYLFPTPELDEENSLSFIQEIAKSVNLQSLGNLRGNELRLIYNLVGGNPLTLRLVIGQLQVYPLQKILLDLHKMKSKGDEDVYFYLLDHSWKNLTKMEKNVLLAMPLADVEGAPLEFLSAICRMDTTTLQTSLERLIAFNVVDVREAKHQRFYSIHNLTRTYLHRQVALWEDSVQVTEKQDLFNTEQKVIPVPTTTADYATLFRRNIVSTTEPLRWNITDIDPTTEYMVTVWRG